MQTNVYRLQSTLNKQVTKPTYQNLSTMVKNVLKLFSLLIAILFSAGNMVAQELSPTHPAGPVNNFSVTAYDGYCKVMGKWTLYDNNSLYGKVQPDYYQVWKDGAIVKDETGADKKYPFPKFIDVDVTPGIHSYKVRAHFASGAFGDFSTEITVNVKPRDYSRISYEVKEIYNWRLGSANAANSSDGKSYVAENVGVMGAITNGDSYRNAYFVRVSNSSVTNRGYWYLFDKPNHRIIRTIGGMFSSTGSGTFSNGGNRITGLRSADDWKVATYVPDADKAIGMGVDNAGNIFVRYGSAFWAAPTYAYIIPFDQYASTAADAKTKSTTVWTSVDFSGAGIANHYITGTDGKPLAGQPGRVDYFTIQGNMLGNGTDQTDNTAFIYFSPHGTRSVFRLRINNASRANATSKYTVSTQWKSFQEPATFEYEGNQQTITYGDENYAFHIDGTPSALIHQVRSGGYFDVRSIASSTGGATSKPVLTHNGMINNSGGSTLYFKGKHANGVYCNAMFLITGVSKYSMTSGSFQVNRATAPTQYDYDKITPAQFDFGNLLPVQIFSQREALTNTNAENSNSNFLYAEKLYGKMPGDTEAGWHLYIHQYVPRSRFAMYEIIPRIQFANTTVKIDASLTYEYNHPEDPSLPSDIKGVQAVVSWDRTDFDVHNNGDYKIHDYDVDIVSPSGTITWKMNAPGAYDANGKAVVTITKTENGQSVTSTVELTGTPGEYIDAFNIPLPGATELGIYTATIQTDFYPRSEPTALRPVDPETSKKDVTYETKVPTVEAQVWKGEDGSSVEGQYRVDMQFTHPSPRDGNGDEPATYYELLIDKKDGNGPTKTYVSYGKTVIDNPDYDPDNTSNPDNCCTRFLIVDNKEEAGSFYYLSTVPPTSIRATCSEVCAFNSVEDYQKFINDQYTQTTSIPGTTRHEEDRNYATPEAEEEGGVPSNLTFYPKVNPGEDPTTWDYYIQPVYAAGTPIEKTTQGKATVRNGTTGVGSITEDGVANGGLEIYPNPASSDVTVNLEEPLSNITIYNAAGAAVKSFDFNNDRTSVEINVEGLANGNYILNANRKHSTILIKK